MLPSNLLPDGMLLAMRAKSNQFMQTPIGIYDVSIVYDNYGAQTTVSGLVLSTSGYVGALSGKDIEVLNNSMGMNTVRAGVKTSYFTTILIPFEEIPIQDNYVIRANNKNWSISYHNNDTMNGVQLYTKIIAQRMTYNDERELP